MRSPNLNGSVTILNRSVSNSHKHLFKAGIDQRTTRTMPRVLGSETPMRRFWSNREGNFAMLFAIAIVPIIGAIGVAVDYSLANSYRTDVQKALDTTALALSKMMPADQAVLDDVGTSTSRPVWAHTRWRVWTWSLPRTRERCTSAHPASILRGLQTFSARHVSLEHRDEGPLEHRPGGSGPRPRQYRIDVRRKDRSSSGKAPRSSSTF